ncbi:acyltransferase [Acetobacter okinawensis]|uniref:acyltransferase family protein n=1 Tax=Acetobacter okinawensis TaxID=1076594 RepID=UPI000A39F209|nr:acyltransferase [Acetobacter okinawensis]
MDYLVQNMMSVNLTQKPTIRFQALDGLRGVLALTVMLSHMIGVVTGWDALRPLIGAYISVIYFFIMSGFVLTYAHNKNYSFTYFFLLRLARLWPLHCFTTLSMVLIYIYNSKHLGYVPGSYVFDWKIILKNLLFLHGVTPLQFPLINDPSWSISIEFWGSLLIPIILIKIKPLKRLLITFAFIIALCVQSSSGFSDMTLCNMSQFFLASSAIMLGSSIYSLITPEIIKNIRNTKYYEFFLFICLLSCLVGIYGQSHNKFDYLYIIPFIPLMLIDFQPDTSLIKKIFLSEPIQFFGFISFPLYLIHSSAIIIGLQYRTDNPALSIIMAACLSITISYLYTVYIDSPLYRYMKRKIRNIYSRD